MMSDKFFKYMYSIASLVVMICLLLILTNAILFYVFAIKLEG